MKNLFCRWLYKLWIKHHHIDLKFGINIFQNEERHNSQGHCLLLILIVPKDSRFLMNQVEFFQDPQECNFNVMDNFIRIPALR